ncbi:anion transporter [Litorilinea aerophila]|uniref:Anion transporter n=1 Tax=Litorilinea aerophila TaxID=1204385 RepID=A0A540VAW0_9CHLR|nr:anion transporter [Litorilinea aerophila]MCC9078285.1 anion transporter [Litorilinea aerophila]OUC05564.1 citrate transporter [Litorilinea aerophila]
MALIQGGVFWLSLAVVAVTIVGVAVGRFPLLRMNRATIALTGAALLILLGAIPLEEAYAALDLDTLTLLFAMMILNANLRRAGFFHLVGRWVVQRAHSPRQLLAFIILSSGVLSAVFLNDTIVLTFTPLVLEICRTLKQRPIPYLIALVTAANIGSAGTITGNPQNMIIGVASGMPFLRFTGYLGPVALMGLVLIWIVLLGLYRRELAVDRFDGVPPPSVQAEPRLLRKSLVATGLMVLAFLAGMPIPQAALGAAALLLISRRVDPERVFAEVDWSLLVFFAGLFIVTGSLETLGVSGQLFALMQPVAERGIVSLSLVAVVLSNLISNVPAVLLFRPFVPHFPDPTQAWLTLAMATTFAGNLTLLGSVANLIVAEIARRRGVEMGFGEYLRAGVPITLLSLALGIAWLLWVL